MATRRLADLDMGELHSVASPYLNGCCWHARDAVLTEIVERVEEEGDAEHYGTMVTQLASGAMMHGELNRALELFEEPGVRQGTRVCTLAFYQVIGFPLPETMLDQALAIDDFDAPSLIEPLCRALYAGQRGRWREFARVLAHYDSLAALPDTTYQAGSGRVTPATYAVALRGFEMWKRGQPEAAVPLVEQAFEAGVFAWFLGPLYEELGRYEDAARFYAAQWSFPLSYHSLGRVYEKLERPDDARRAYERFIRAWANADPDMQAWVEEASEGILRTSDRSTY
jgi:tetratricopeptide (TPR) repeat protein